MIVGLAIYVFIWVLVWYEYVNAKIEHHYSMKQ
jgi:hypothetical protein